MILAMFKTQTKTQNKTQNKTQTKTQDGPAVVQYMLYNTNSLKKKDFFYYYCDGLKSLRSMTL